MNLVINMNKEMVLQIQSKNTILLYGASSSGNRVKNNLLHMNVEPERIIFFDSNEKKQGTLFFGSLVLNRVEFDGLPRDTLIFISSTVYYEIEKFLKSKNFNNYHFVHELIFSNKSYEKFDKEFSDYLRNNNAKSNIDHDELYTIYQSLRTLKAHEGAIAEVGVYKGGSAYLLGKFSNGKTLYLFDTFEGLPRQSSFSGLSANVSEPSEGWLSDNNLDEVENYIQSSGVDKNKIIIKKGIFPATAKDIGDVKFSLVHLDSDLYQTTKDALEYFFPRLEGGGRVILHDYNCCGCPGVKLAVDEFVNANRLQFNLIEIAESQAVLIK